MVRYCGQCMPCRMLTRDFRRESTPYGTIVLSKFHRPTYKCDEFMAKTRPRCRDLRTTCICSLCFRLVKQRIKSRNFERVILFHYRTGTWRQDFQFKSFFPSLFGSACVLQVHICLYLINRMYVIIST